MNAAMADRKDRLIRERIHDPYQPKRKPAEPCVSRLLRRVLRGTVAMGGVVAGEFASGTLPGLPPRA